MVDCLEAVGASAWIAALSSDHAPDRAPGDPVMDRQACRIALRGPGRSKSRTPCIRASAGPFASKHVGGKAPARFCFSQNRRPSDTRTAGRLRDGVCACQYLCLSIGVTALPRGRRFPPLALLQLGEALLGSCDSAAAAQRSVRQSFCEYPSSRYPPSDFEILALRCTLIHQENRKEPGYFYLALLAVLPRRWRRVGQALG